MIDYKVNYNINISDSDIDNIVNNMKRGLITIDEGMERLAEL